MIVSRIHLQFFLAFICSAILLHVVTAASSTDKRERNKRELPLSRNCDPREPGSCFKADLVNKKVANCEKDAHLWEIFSTCKPINDLLASSVVDIANKSKGKDCVPVNVKGGFRCSDSRTHTRCVCDKRLIASQCRCQYWPKNDVRENQPSFCTQYDHGGQEKSLKNISEGIFKVKLNGTLKGILLKLNGTLKGKLKEIYNKKVKVHFYTCCNNCNDDNDIQSNPCDNHTYHGGGSTYNYCSKCGTNKGGGRATYRFTCNSCDKQRECEDLCNTNLISPYILGFCPKWSGCFRKCCISGRNRNKKNTDSEEIGNFCGDLICQNGENHENCPFDCCPIYNPTNCSLSCNTNGTSGCSCPPRCCEESHCCNVAPTISDNGPPSPNLKQHPCN